MELTSYCTIGEAAKELGLATSSIRRMIHEETLSARNATTEELVVLLSTGRIKGVPGTGVKLIERHEVERAKGRNQKPGNPHFAHR